MAELILMRQRITTVETIKKITHAMRLVSMSAHAHLSKQYNAIRQYHAALATILEQLHNARIIDTNTEINGSNNAKKRIQSHLLIVIASEKGLCGSFNSNLFYALDEHMGKKITTTFLMPIGKKSSDFIQTNYPNECVTPFPHLTLQMAGAIAQTVAERICGQLSHYATISVLSNALKSFFIQSPRITPIMPINLPRQKSNSLSEEYIWDIDPQELITYVTQQYIVSTLHNLLLESLLAEQAARFLSMDSSTRNAEKILETTRLKYNKLRQAKITKEIIELADAL